MPRRSSPKTGYEKPTDWATVLKRQGDHINKRTKGDIPDPHHPTILTAGPKGSNTPDRFSADVPPADWPGTKPEWMVYNTLKNQGQSPEIDFSYQSSLLGGRSMLGGIVVDFLFFTKPLALNIQGNYWHYDQGVDKIATDEIQRAQLTSLGYTVVYIDEQDVDNNADYFVAEALRGHDHSMAVH